MPDIHEPPFAMRATPPARARCASYFNGHTPHWIPALRSRRSPDEAWQRVVVMTVLGDEVALAVGDELRRYRNHEPAYLDWVVREVGAEAELNTEFHYLFLRPRTDGARSVFSLLPADREPHECHPLS